MAVQNIAECQISVYGEGSVCVIFRRDTATFEPTDRSAGSVAIVQELICRDETVNNSNAYYISGKSRVDGLRRSSHLRIRSHCQLIHSLAKQFLCVFFF